MKNEYNSNAIAVISMIGRFPGAPDTGKFWENLKNGVESVSRFSRQEIRLEGEEASGSRQFMGADAVLADIDQFDAAFFEISPREAEIMDPQHRLFIEACWEAMERAGYTSEKYPGIIAVFGGANLSSYMIRNLYSNPGLVERIGTFKTMLLNGQDFLSTRVSYLMDLKGPSINVNTLCSSSLVAIHLACQSLLEYHCDLALAGGVNIQVSQNEALFYQEGGIGAADGHCKAFDAAADGTVSGSGLGVVVLKRLEDALKEGDNIEAVIRGSAVNNDGSSKNSYTAPNPDGQAACIADAIAMADVNPETITLVEAHGTGTNLGDPIEIAGLTKAFRAYTNKNRFCAIGSVKTNIGHLVTAGGVASLIKTILAMKNKAIPASLNFKTPNPKINFDTTPFFVNTTLTRWERIEAATPLRAGISSFGIGGTNAHLVLEEAPGQQETRDPRSWKMFTLSARTRSALNVMRKNMLAFLRDNTQLNPADMAYTLHLGRRDFENKLFVLYNGLDDLADNLESAPVIHTEKPVKLPVLFIIPGEEEYSPGLGRELYRNEPLFQELFTGCAETISAKQGLNLQELLFKETIPPGITGKLYHFALTYALAGFWMRCGIKPAAIAAYGNGLVTAACLCGKISAEEAVARIAGAGGRAFAGSALDILPLDDGQGQLSTEALAGLAARGEEIRIVVGYANQQIRNSAGTGRLLATLDNAAGSETRVLLEALAYYWLWNGGVDWNGYYAGQPARRIPLPTYPFEHKRYWIEPGGGNRESTKHTHQELNKRPRPELETSYVPCSSETEKVLAASWENALGIEKIGINDDFYALGGHSLIAASLANALSEHFGIRLQLAELMEYTTIASLAEMIETYRWAASQVAAVSVAGEAVKEGQV